MAVIIKLKGVAGGARSLAIARELQEMEQETGIIVLDDRFEFPPVATEAEIIAVEQENYYSSEKWRDIRKQIDERCKQEKIKFIERVFGIRLFDWQKDFIFNNVPYDRAIGFARRAGKTFAHCLKICFSEGEPLRIYKHQYCQPENRFIEIAAEDGQTQQRLDFFIDELQGIYEMLSKAGTPWLREIHFRKK